MRNRGFTIIEVLSVVIIISLIATISIIGYYGIKDRAQNAATEEYIRNIKRLIETHKLKTGGSPIASGDTKNESSFDYTSCLGDPSNYLSSSQAICWLKTRPGDQPFIQNDPQLFSSMCEGWGLEVGSPGFIECVNEGQAYNQQLVTEYEEDRQLRNQSFASRAQEVKNTLQQYSGGTDISYKEDCIVHRNVCWYGPTYIDSPWAFAVVEDSYDGTGSIWDYSSDSVPGGYLIYLLKGKVKCNVAGSMGGSYKTSEGSEIYYLKYKQNGEGGIQYSNGNTLCIVGVEYFSRNGEPQ